VPGPPPPPPSAQPKLSLGRPGHAQQSQPGDSPPTRATPVYRPIDPPAQKKKRGAMTWVTIGVVVIALGVGGYYGYEWYSKHQEEAKANPPQVAKKSEGGDQTGNDGASRPGDPAQPRSRGGKPMPGIAAAPDGSVASAAEKELPVIPAVWTLELDTVKIPQGRANGKISGTDFVVESARVDIVGGAHVLSLRQGAGVSPDREMLVYLHPKAGETLAGHTWAVSKDMKGANVPQVAKRWKTNPKFAPTQKNFSTGYAMKLQFDPATNEISGKIFLALPDPEQSVVAGMFKATASLAGAAAPVAAPTPTPAPALNPEFQKRYGIKR